MVSRIDKLNVGVAGIQRWRHEDEVHLPEARARGPAYLPLVRPLDEILRRETLDERLARHLLPSEIDADLMQPRVMSDTRQALRARMAQAAAGAEGQRGRALAAAADLLDVEVTLDAEIREALAALLRG
ncbi:hypothetical protein [Pseudooceanicola aestuarii]|uniref:type III secretion apparatus assembly protein SctX n=1 Tax=Pseudooceanicola aestuarii TaxID=2697319 RepID=UPI0013D55B54|nr:hypothetical protein [Pseudooceanicola aestuarii]